MMLLMWRPEYAVGNGELDLQHQRLIEIVNELDMALRRGDSAHRLEAALHELIRFAKIHFATEERYMEASRFPGYSMHRQQHEALAREVARLAADVRSGRISLSLRIAAILSEWLEEHIRVSDQLYAKHCRWLRAMGPQLAAH